MSNGRTSVCEKYQDRIKKYVGLDLSDKEELINCSNQEDFQDYYYMYEIKVNKPRVSEISKQIRGSQLYNCYLSEDSLRQELLKLSTVGFWKPTSIGYTFNSLMIDDKQASEIISNEKYSYSAIFDTIAGVLYFEFYDL